MRSQAEGSVIQPNNTSLGKQNRQSKATMTAEIGKQSAAIDVDYLIDHETRLPAYLDH